MRSRLASLLRHWADRLAPRGQWLHDPRSCSTLAIISSAGAIHRVVLPPGSVVSIGGREVYIPSGEQRAVRWDGDYEVLATRPRVLVDGV